MFKKDFILGAAAASYQIEGAAFEDGKGLSIWDVFSHTPGKIRNGDNGDVACDHYHRLEEDVKIMKELGLKAYRFSFSWPRILPNGTGEVNPKGIEFYNKLIDCLLENGIEPFATLYHWDLPYELYKKGGWLNPECADWFAEYARVVAENFGDRLKNYMTFNEPACTVTLGYYEGVHAPGLKLPNDEILMMSHNILISHGRAVREIRKAVEGAKVGIVINFGPQIPASKEAEARLHEKYMNYDHTNYHWQGNFWWEPLFNGKYHPDIDKYIKEKNLPMTEGFDIITEPMDFMGMNIYSGHYFDIDENGNFYELDHKPGEATTHIGWYMTYPALYWGIKEVTEQYNIPVYITENGLSCSDMVFSDGKVHDPQRIEFTKGYLEGVERAYAEGMPIKGYFHWSVMDNFEWALGYNERFGMVYVDMQTGKRTIKDSGYWYKEYIETHIEK